MCGIVCVCICIGYLLVVVPCTKCVCTCVYVRVHYIVHCATMFFSDHLRLHTWWVGMDDFHDFSMALSTNAQLSF